MPDSPSIPITFRSLCRVSLPNFLSAASRRRRPTQSGRSASPRDPLAGIFRVQLGGAELSLGHVESAIDESRKAIDFGNHEYYAYANLAAAYAQAGKMDEAKAALAEARSRNPELTAKWMNEHTPTLPAVFDGLRKAGLPEE